MPTVTLQSRSYLPVATAALTPASVLDCDLYLQRPGCSYAELYRGKDYPLVIDDLTRLREQGVDRLFIKVEDANRFRDYLCQNVLNRADLPMPARMKSLREVTRVSLETALAANNADEIVNISTGFGRDLAAMVAERSLVFRELFTTMEHDYYTFTHLCNVSMYCAVLASRLGACDEAGLAELASGALLHDIGKRHIPAHVLNKPGKLTNEEWEVVRQHPTKGFRELVGRDDVTWPQLMMVYQHHERMDGSGYPTGIGPDEMHPWARICAVADVFDALTCHRPYRDALSVPEACEYLIKRASGWFDSEVLACWMEHVRSVA